VCTPARATWATACSVTPSCPSGGECLDQGMVCPRDGSGKSRLPVPTQPATKWKNDDGVKVGANVNGFST